MEILHIFLTVSRYSSEGRILQGNIPTEFESGYKLWKSLRQGRAGVYEVRPGAASPRPVRITSGLVSHGPIKPRMISFISESSLPEQSQITKSHNGFSDKNDSAYAFSQVVTLSRYRPSLCGHSLQQAPPLQSPTVCLEKIRSHLSQACFCCSAAC